MQYEFANNLLTVNVSAIQAVALAVVTPEFYSKFLI
jgi:hypothetical protein